MFQANEREIILKRIRTLRTGAAEISQLLADDALCGDDWDRAARVLASCRHERKCLDEHLRRSKDRGTIG